MPPDEMLWPIDMLREAAANAPVPTSQEFGLTTRPLKVDNTGTAPLSVRLAETDAKWRTLYGEPDLKARIVALETEVAALKAEIRGTKQP